MSVFTFWEGSMPAYIKLCMDTWKIPVTALNYSNLHNYTDLRVDRSLTRFSLAQIADCVRVHVLRDHGGYWLDADTIMLADKLPDVTILGDPDARTNTIGMLHSEPHSEMFTEWARYQDAVIADPNASHHWSIMGNAFTDPYLATHTEIQIGSIYEYWPETYMIVGDPSDRTRYYKYLQFYFDCSYRLSDLKQPNMLMLHNSWTPKWYKDLAPSEVISKNCTLSNILKELLGDNK